MYYITTIYNQFKKAIVENDFSLINVTYLFIVLFTNYLLCCYTNKYL